MRTPRRSVLALLLLLAPTTALAADGPGLGNRAYSSNELWTSVGTITSPRSHGSTHMANGYLLVPYSSDGGGFSGDGGIDFWDVSDPRDPILYRRYDDADTHGLREAHGFGFSTSYGADVWVVQGVFGIQFWDITDPDAVFLIDYMDLPGIVRGDYSGDWWVFFQAPYVYVAGVDQGLYVVDASDPANPVLVNQVPTSAIAGLNPGMTFAIGNLLVIMRNQNNGYATLDISDPTNPTLISSSAGDNGYSHLFAAGKILTSGGNGGVNRMVVHDVAPDGTSITRAGHSTNSCSPSLNLANGGYGSYQDGFFFSGFSRVVAKFDIASQSLIGCASAGALNHDEDFGIVLGNLLWAGNDHDGGTGLIVHQTARDTTGPDVTWVHPPDGATDQALTSRVGVSMSDLIELDSVDAASFQVRPLGGAALPGKYSVNQGIVNFSPDLPLSSNTTYEVVVNGMEDFAGNAGGGFLSTFTTGTPGPPTCSVAPPAPVETGSLAAFDAATVGGPGPIDYAWDFGDGNATSPSSTSAASHTYTAPGRYAVVLTVSNPFGSSSCSAVEIVHNALTPLPATASSPIVHDGVRAYNVNPDNDTVTAIHDSSLTVAWEAPVGDNPRTLTVAPNGDLWVANQGDATVSVLDPASGGLLQTIDLPRSSQPYGVVFAPDGLAAYVTLEATGTLLELSPAGTITATLDVGPRPRGIAVSGDSSRILVTRFTSPAIDPANPSLLPEAEVREIDAGTFAVVRIFPLAFDPGPDTEASGRGVPNYLSAVRVSPDGLRAVVPSKKDNVARGAYLDGQDLTFESRTRTILSELDLLGNAENLAARIDFDDRDMAQSALFSPLGDLVFVALQGSNLVEVRDANDPSTRLATLVTGRAPQGLVFNGDASRLFVHNYMSRSVSVFAVSELIAGTSTGTTPLGELATVAVEALTAEALLGKQIFYDASNPKMGHGKVHWTANFDEIQDFENDIRLGFDGTGFLSDPDFAATANPLGAPKAGLSPELDALAAYLASLDGFALSPYRQPDGQLTAEGSDGRAAFFALRCNRCHGGSAFRDGQRHDVGTVQASSGQASGSPLAGVGFDTPTLKGVWKTAPYLHNGQAASLRDVLGNPAHVGFLSEAQKDVLVAYLLQLDELETQDTQSCGLGFELALILPGFLWLRRRRR